MSNLSPCPHCGVEDGDHDEGIPFLQIEPFGRRYGVRCSNCGGVGPRASDPQAATEAWNRRAYNPAIEECDAYKGSLDAATLRAEELESELAHGILEATSIACNRASAAELRVAELERFIKSSWTNFRGGDCGDPHCEICEGYRLILAPSAPSEKGD